MKTSKPVIMGLAFAFLMMMILELAWAKGRPWNISVDSAADADGGTIQIIVTLEGPGLPDTPVVANVLLPGGRKAARKCQDIANALDMSRHLTASCSGTMVKVEVQDNSPFSEIKGIQINDSQTGEHLTGIRDDPQGQPLLERAFIEFRTGSESEGEANLQIGTGPLATVPTTRLSALEIAESLTVTFNEVYGGSGYTAELFGEIVVVDDVPCEEGITAGSSDSSLDFSFGMIRVADAVPPEEPGEPPGRLSSKTLCGEKGTDQNLRN